MSFLVLSLIASILVLSCKAEDCSAVLCQVNNLKTEMENKLNDINSKLDSITDTVKDCCNAAKTHLIPAQMSKRMTQTANQAITIFLIKKAHLSVYTVIWMSYAIQLMVG